MINHPAATFLLLSVVFTSGQFFKSVLASGLRTHLPLADGSLGMDAAGCDGDGIPLAGTTCVTQAAGGCKLQVGPDSLPTVENLNSPQQGHVVLTNDGSAVAVSGSTHGGCNVATVQFKDTFDPPPGNCSPDGNWLELWFGGVGVANTNIKSFNVTIVDPILPDFMGGNFSYRQWGVAAQPADLPEDLINREGFYANACDFQGNTSFGVYNSVIKNSFASGPQPTTINGVGGLKPGSLPIPPGHFMIEENVELFGRRAYGFGTVLSPESLGDRVYFSLESRMTDLWKLTSRVLGTPIETSLTFSHTAVMKIFDEASMNGDLPKNSTAYKIADNNDWKWVFVPYMWKKIADLPQRLADIPRSFVNISKYEDVHIELEPQDGNPNPGFNKSIGYDDGMEITGKLFNDMLYLNFTTLHLDWGLNGKLNDVANDYYPWRVCVVDSLLAYKRGCENAMNFNYTTMTGSFNMTFENSTESSACASGVCAPTIQTCTTAYWVEWCTAEAEGLSAPNWCTTAAENL